MKVSNFYIKTLKNISLKKNTTISEKFLIKTGIIKKISAGIYTYMPLGLRIINKIIFIIKNEMNKSKAIEILMPLIQPKDIWEETKRLRKLGKEVISFNDRNNKQYIIQPTSEELITKIIKNEINSYKDLPLNFYQIQTKFRDEIRPKNCLIRSREFIMKDSYSFDININGLNKSYKIMYNTYIKIFKKLKINYKIINADNGDTGGFISHEFHSINKDKKTIEIGHIFKLGTIYSKPMKAFYKKKDGKLNLIQMGCYGLGITRILSAIIEQNNDGNGIIWPKNTISPFEVVICILNKKNKIINNCAKKIYKIFKKYNIDVIFDDRNKYIGNILYDWELIGIPHCFIVGNNFLKKTKIEYKYRKNFNISKFFKIKNLIKFIKIIKLLKI